MKFKLSIFLFFISLVLTSQNTVSIDYSELELSKAFIDIEKKFNIKLSFNSNLTDNKRITIKLDNVSLEEILLAFEEKANILFEKITGRYYIIKEKAKIDLSKTQHLQEIVIKENLILGVKKNNDDSSISIFPNNLEILPGLTEPDVLQSIQLIPGVQSPTETASGLYIRGGTPDQNLILWDGIKMYHSGHFFGTISAFNPYITDKIKLYKNGTKARYGNRISGVVDITSTNDIPLNTKGGFGFNMTHADAYLNSPIGKHAAILVSARRSINDVINTKTFKNLSDRVFQNTKISEGNKVFEDDEVITTNDLFYFTDYTIKAIVKPNSKDEIQFSNVFTKNKLDYGFLIEEFGEASNDKLDINNQGSSINWKHVYSEKFSQTINAYYSKYDLKYAGSNSIADEFSDELNKQNKINDFGVSVSSNLKLKENNVIGFGYQYSTDKVKYVLRFQDSESPEENFNESNLEKNNTHAIYTDYQYKIEDKLNLNVGIRGNYFSVLDKLYIEPRLNFEARLNTNFKFKMSAEKLHQSISQVVEFNTQEFGLENQIWILSDGDQIPLLKSTQLTSGFIFSKNGWYIDVESFYKNIKGLTSLTVGFNNNEDFFSKGKSNVFGVDLFLKKKIKNYNTWLSYSFINNDYKFNDINNGNTFPGNSDITHHFTWSHTYNWKNFDVSLGWNIRTGIPYTQAKDITETNDGFVINFEEINGKRLPNYHRLDLSTTYKFNFSSNKRWKGKIGFSLLNLYNKKNILSRTYEKRQSLTENTEVLREVDKISLGITPNLVFRAEF